jgi:hypothetical protein
MDRCALCVSMWRLTHPQASADNIFTVKSWLHREYGIDESALEQQFEIPADLDYVETKL